MSMLALTISDKSGKKKRFPLYRNGMTIGRAAENDIVLNDLSVSKFHAEIFLDDVSTRIGDGVNGRPSSNGLLLNKERVGQSTKLSPGDNLVIGVYQFTVEEEGPLDLQVQEDTFEIENLVQLKAAILFERKTPKVVDKIVQGAILMGISDDRIFQIFDDVIEKLRSEGKSDQIPELLELRQRLLGIPRSDKETKGKGGHLSSPEDRILKEETLRFSTSAVNPPARPSVPNWLFITGLAVLMLIGMSIILWKS